LFTKNPTSPGDERLANLIDTAIESLSDGLQLTFNDLQGMSGADSDVIVVAYSAGMLGFQSFRTELEKIHRIRIENRWFEENLFKFMAYRDGLALFEFFHKTMPHIMLAYNLHRVKVAADIRGDVLVLEDSGVRVEDDHLIELADESNGFTVGEILAGCSRIYAEEVVWGLAVLAGIGCVDLEPAGDG